MTRTVHTASGRLGRSARALARDARGGASLEYVITLGLVSVGAALATAALGQRLLELYLHQRAILLSPIP